VTVKFRSVSTATNTTGTSATVVSVTRPTGVVDGDTLIAVASGAQGTLTPPASGWTFLGTFRDAAGMDSWAYKKTASGEAASENWTFSVSSAINVSVAAFVGGYDLASWSAEVTSTADPATLNGLDATRDSVAWQVYCWQNATGNSTATWSFGAEKHDITSKATGAIWRGQTGMYYGQPDVTDIVNAGDLMPGGVANPSVAPTHAVGWAFLVGDKEPDAETWSDTDGDFAVELKLDVNELNTVGSITSHFRGDITGRVTSFGASVETTPAANAADGLSSTYWSDTASGDDQWVGYDLVTDATIRRYRLTSWTGSTDLDPMDWSFQGSPDGSAWTTLDTRSNESFGARGETREYRVSTPGPWRYYRVLVTNNLSSGSSTGAALAEFRLSTIDVWEDVTSFVNEESKIRITRGLQGTSGRSDFSRAYMELNNTDGRFSLRNPDGMYFGALQRNTQERISKAYGTIGLHLQGEVDARGTDVLGDSLQCPLTNENSVSQSMDARIDVEPESWRQEQSLMGASGSPDSFAAWHLYLLDDGRLRLTWFDSTVETSLTSTIAVPQTTTRRSIRVEHDNFLGSSTATFYTADTFNGSWVQLGEVVTDASTTTQFHTGGSLCVGHVPSESVDALHGIVYNFELLDASDVVVAGFDTSALTNGAHVFTDAYGNNWITVNNAFIANRRYRFHGEVAEWPLAWDPTGTWITASATGAGVQKRLERGGDPLSTMRRYHTKGVVELPTAFSVYAEPDAYWPMEDGSESFVLASGIPSKPVMNIYGVPDFEGEFDAFKESDSVIRFDGARLSGAVAGSTNGYTDLRFLFYAPTAPANGSTIITLYTSGSIRRWDLDFQSAGLWRIQGFNEAALETGTPTVTASSIAVATTGEKMHVRFVLDQSGADVLWLLDAMDVYSTDLGGSSGTFSTQTVGRTSQVNLNTDGALVDAYMGHVAVYGLVSPPFAGTELNAHHYETSAARVKRLALEEQVEFRHVGAIDESAFMGYQTSEAPFQAMSSSAVTEDGFLVDPLDAFGVEFRTLRSMFNQPPAVTLSYTGNELSGNLVPSPDDAHVVNDFTASRGGAGSARYRLSDGALSVQAPPSGVGPYESGQSYSLAHEGQCVDIASWQVRRGTIDEERYPRIQVALENLRIAADPALTEAILMIDVGKRLDIGDTPTFLPTEDIRQVVIGYEEWFDNFQHNFTFNALPERVFEVAQYDADDRFAPHDAVTYQDIGTADTLIEVVNPTGQSWSETAADFDILIDSERITVTQVANTAAFYTTDSFTRANSTTTLGSTELGTPKAWTAQINTWGIESNQAYIAATGNALATFDASADFEEVAVTASVLPATREFWVNFRYSDNPNRWRFGGTEGATCRLEKIVAGAVTSYTGPTGFTIAQGDRLVVRCHGTVIEAFLNGRQAFCITDTFNQTATMVGMQIAVNDVRLDDFSWVDDTPRQTFLSTRGVGVTDAKPHRAGSAVKLFKPPYRGL
jgi:hypothetical protein